MKNRFDIQKQLGLARTGKITWDELKFKIPNVLLPLNSVFDKYLQPMGGSLYPSIKQFIEGNEPCVGYTIEDSLEIIPTKPSNPTISEEKEEASTNSAGILPILVESKKMWGIPEKTASPGDFLSGPLPILTANVPNASPYRYKRYVKDMMATRLALYEEVLFPRDPQAKYLLEFNFSQDIDFLPALLEWLQRNRDHIIGIKISDIFKYLGQSQKILHWIFTLKAELPSNWIWIVGGQINPEYYALAIYLGFDLIDTRGAYLTGMGGRYYTGTGSCYMRELKYPLCACPACNQLLNKLPFSKRENMEEKQLIIFHNLFLSLQELQRCKQTLYDGSLRTYLESKTHASPSLASFLRILDGKYGDLINRRYPVFNTHKLLCIGNESYVRPEIQNFIQRIKSEIIPARKYPVAVLLPCSAKKPYSESKSHRKFMKTIRKASGNDYAKVHQVIITSPLGLIPREPENIFPAAHYGIPVTGDWDVDEIAITADCIIDWLQKYIIDQDSITIIAHLPGGYRRACEAAEVRLRKIYKDQSPFPLNIIYTIDPATQKGPTADVNLEKMHSEIAGAFAAYHKTRQNSPKENSSDTPLTRITPNEVVIRGTLDYQMGKGAGDLIVSRGAVLIKGRNPRFNEILVYDGAGKIILGRLYANNGLIKLAPKGAELLKEHNHNWIHLTEGTMGGTTVFKPILKNIDPWSHPGDEMLVFNSENEYIGVGELLQAPEDTLTATAGKICKLKAKVKHSGKGKSKKKTKKPAPASSDLDFLKDIE